MKEAMGCKTRVRIPKKYRDSINKLTKTTTRNFNNRPIWIVFRIIKIAKTAKILVKNSLEFQIIIIQQQINRNLSQSQHLCPLHPLAPNCNWAGIFHRFRPIIDHRLEEAGVTVLTGHKYRRRITTKDPLVFLKQHLLEVAITRPLLKTRGFPRSLSSMMTKTQTIWQLLASTSSTLKPNSIRIARPQASQVGVDLSGRQIRITKGRRKWTRKASIKTCLDWAHRPDPTIRSCRADPIKVCSCLSIT